MKRYWELARTKVDDMSFRERAMIFAAAAFVVVALLKVILLDPLLDRQKALSDQVVQQQNKSRELQAALENLVQAKRDDAQSPLRIRVNQLQQQLQEQDAYLKSRRDRLIAPDKMADLLKDVLSRNNALQLVSLKTLPVSLLVDKTSPDGSAVEAKEKEKKNPSQKQDGQRQIYKHGVQITVRGGYLDLVRYLTALEHMPTQMFWGEASFTVDKHPNGSLTLTLFTLSLDKTWLTV